ncbi:hypothetical protein [Mycoplasma crocodyli]|nr:hypothetical protein [Mycoplasma crocodyli]
MALPSKSTAKTVLNYLFFSNSYEKQPAPLNKSNILNFIICLLT